MLVRTSDGTPVDETTFRRSHKSVSFPRGELPADILAEYGYAPLTLEPAPSLSGKQRAARKAAPELVDGEWVHKWTVEDLPITEADVRAEAERRIAEIAPTWKQMEYIMRAVILMAKDTLTTQERSRLQALRTGFQRVQAIGAAAEALEAMDPIPRDYADNKHWSD